MVGVCRTPRPKLQNKSKQRTVLANKLEGHIEAGHASKERREISFLRKFNADEGWTCLAIVLFYVLKERDVIGSTDDDGFDQLESFVALSKGVPVATAPFFDAKIDNDKVVIATR